VTHPFHPLHERTFDVVDRCFEYNGYGEVERVYTDAGYSETFGRDGAGRLTSIQSVIPGAIVAAWSIAYRLDGKPESITRTLPAPGRGDSAEP
jgi:hypothetical protein